MQDIDLMMKDKEIKTKQMEYIVKIYGVYIYRVSRSYQDIREEEIRECTGLNIHFVSLERYTKNGITNKYPTCSLRSQECSDMKKTEPVEK